MTRRFTTGEILGSAASEEDPACTHDLTILPVGPGPGIDPAWTEKSCLCIGALIFHENQNAQEGNQAAVLAFEEFIALNLKSTVPPFRLFGRVQVGETNARPRPAAAGSGCSLTLG